MLAYKNQRFVYKSIMLNRVKEVRNITGLTQSDLAELCGVSLQMIQYIENGQRQLTVNWIEKIVSAFHEAGFTDIQPYYLITDPSTIVDDRDRELIARYKASPKNIRQRVEKLLGLKEIAETE